MVPVYICTGVIPLVAPACLDVQLAALDCADEADPLASSIGAANTLMRQPGGGLKAYNTDCSAAISAVESALGGAPSSVLVALCSIIFWPDACRLYAA